MIACPSCGHRLRKPLPKAAALLEGLDLTAAITSVGVGSTQLADIHRLSGYARGVCTP